ncbi:MAG: triphosphoribosyl-dephospho-CoA synthase [Pirellula sp.]|nr:triphosphoribosyl-dephospho-CoA synthase [Pirellula sp.]
MKTVGDKIRIAIVRECSAPKLGNVYPGADFTDMSYETFCTASSAIGAAVDELLYNTGSRSGDLGIGDYCLSMVQAMMDSVGKNTSLGTILLLAPLVVAGERSKPIGQVLSGLSPRDTSLVYESIRIANPGGIGQAAQMDVAQAAPPSLEEAMRFASSYDDVALQYVSEFELVERLGRRIAELALQPVLASAEQQDSQQESQGIQKSVTELLFNRAVQRIQLELLAERVDSLIVRKSGIELANVVTNRCRAMLGMSPDEERWQERWSELDRWMREQRNSAGKHLVNPGTTADLIAAAIFFCMQNELCQVPCS